MGTVATERKAKQNSHVSLLTVQVQKAFLEN